MGMQDAQPKEQDNWKNCLEASTFLSELDWISAKRVCSEGAQGEEWGGGVLEDSE